MQVAPTEHSRGAWVRSEDNTYGARKFPFGKCSECDRPACHEVPGDRGQRLVCMQHRPEHIVFAPFLGQQTKIFIATQRWVLAGGGAGGSKTYGGSRLWLKQYFFEEARYQKAKAEGREFSSKGWAIFFRRTMPELLQVIEDFKKYYKKVDPDARWVEQQKLCVFSNGFKVQFGGMEDDDGYLRYYGGEYSLVVIDEATQFTVKQIEEIDARIRCSDPVLSKRLQLYLLTNPVGGVTKQWLRDKYVKAGAPEQPIEVTAVLADGRHVTEYQIYIPSNLYDNPALVGDGRYEASLKRRNSAMKRALLDNDWDVDEGTWVGDDWDANFHIVRPHPIPKSWPRFKMADWGFTARTSIMWAAMDPNGGMVVYRAFTCKRLTATEVARKIKEIESEPLFWKDPDTGQRIQIVPPEWDQSMDCSEINGPLDSACWSRTGHELSIGEILDNAGAGFYKSAKGTNTRHAAADQIRSRLQARHPSPFGNGDRMDVAGLRFFAGTAEPRINNQDGRPTLSGPVHTLPVLPFDPNDPDVPDTNEDDHDWDALAYGVMSRPTSAEDREENELLDWMALRAPKNSDQKIAW